MWQRRCFSVDIDTLPVVNCSVDVVSVRQYNIQPADAGYGEFAVRKIAVGENVRYI